VLLALATPSVAKCQAPSSNDFVEFQLDSAAVRDLGELAADVAPAEYDKTEAEQDRQSMLGDLYNQGRDSLDEGDYSSASKTFHQLAQMAGPQTDAALYWLAYSDNKLGRRDSALESIAELKKRFPQSRWKKDGEALEIEIRQNSGHPVNPDSQTDDDLKILALQGIILSDPSKGIPLVEKYLSGPATPSDKSKALFMLVQSGSPQGQEMLANIARGLSNPELQRKAIEYLAMSGGPNSAKLLAQIYVSASDAEVKRAVLHSYLISNDRQAVEAAAKNETNESLKREAIRQLGLMGDLSSLQTLYASEKSIDTKKEILQGFFLAGDSARLSQLALSESDPELRKAAIRDLGLMGGKDPALQTIYAKETDPGVKEEVLNAYFLAGNANALIAIARTEKDPELKKAAVSKLSLMHSKEGSDYLMELLQK
jgi:HEAT repeats